MVALSARTERQATGSRPRTIGLPASKPVATLDEKQLKSHIERYGNIAHLWSSYALYRDGKQVARGINSIQAIKEAGGWRTELNHETEAVD